MRVRDSECLDRGEDFRIGVKGVLVEEDIPRAIYLHPNSAYTATFLGETNLMAGTVVKRSVADGMVQVDTKLGQLMCLTGHGPAVQDSV